MSYKLKRFGNTVSGLKTMRKLCRANLNLQIKMLHQKCHVFSVLSTFLVVLLPWQIQDLPQNSHRDCSFHSQTSQNVFFGPISMPSVLFEWVKSPHASMKQIAASTRNCTRMCMSVRNACVFMESLPRVMRAPTAYEMRLKGVLMIGPLPRAKDTEMWMFRKCESCHEACIFLSRRCGD